MANDSSLRGARGLAFVVALGAAGAYGATLQAVPSIVDALLVPAAIGLGLAAATGAVFARRLGAGTVALLVASCVAVFGSVAWMPLDGRAAPVTSVAIVDWLLVRREWPTLIGTGIALVCLLVGYRLDSARRFPLGAIALWVAAHVAAGVIEFGGACGGWSPRFGAAASLSVYAVAAALVIALGRVRSPAAIPAAWIPCALVLMLGPPDMIRGALQPALATAAALDEQVETGAFVPWRANADAGLLPAEHFLIVLANGERLAVHRDHVRKLAPEEIWAPAASPRIARVVLDEDITAAQLLAVLRRVGTPRVGLAAIDYTPTPAVLAASSVRAAVQRVAVVPVELVSYAPPLPLGWGPCVDLREVPPHEPLEPHVRGVNCVTNATLGEYTAPPASPPPRPWLPSRPVWPPLVALAIAIAMTWRGWRPQGGRAVYVIGLTVTAMMTGAVIFRSIS